MAAGTSDGMFMRCVYEGSIGDREGEIKRRPYHRNCGCALHKSHGSCSHSGARSASLSYLMRKSWSEGSLAMMASVLSHSPSSSPVQANVGRSTWLGCYNYDGDWE